MPGCRLAGSSLEPAVVQFARLGCERREHICEHVRDAHQRLHVHLRRGVAHRAHDRSCDLSRRLYRTEGSGDVLGRERGSIREEFRLGARRQHERHAHAPTPPAPPAAPASAPSARTCWRRTRRDTASSASPRSSPRSRCAPTPAGAYGGAPRGWRCAPRARSSPAARGRRPRACPRHARRGRNRRCSRARRCARTWRWPPQ